MKKHKKYVVYSPTRTGSTLYCRVLDLYIQQLYGTTNNVFWGEWDSAISNYTTHSIYHLHNIDAFIQAPKNFIKVLTTRNILESVISHCIVDCTKIPHCNNERERKKYIELLANKKFTVDPSWFKADIKRYNELYQLADNCVKRCKNSIVLDYQDHALNIKNLCNKFEIDPTTARQIRSNPLVVNGGTRVVDKFTLINNLDVLVNIYLEADINFRFNENRTLSHIRRTYLKTR